MLPPYPAADVPSSVPPTAHPGPTLFLILALWAASILAVLAVLVPLDWRFDDSTLMSQQGSKLVPNAASAKYARVQGNSVEVANSGDAPVILGLGIRTPFRAVDSNLVTVDSSPVPPGSMLALLWLRRSHPNQVEEQLLKVDHERIVPTLLDRNPEWEGEIAWVGLGVKHVAERPLLIKSVELRLAGVGTRLADMAHDWTYFNGWDGRSINVAFGGREDQRTYLPPVAALGAALAAGAAWLFAQRKRSRPSTAWLVIPFIASWIAVDLRWEHNLLLEVAKTREAFGGKTLEARHAAMPDGPLYQFLQAALRRLPSEPVRIFVTSDFDYFRLRAGYHLYPHNVLAFDWADPAVLHSGDYVVLYHKSDVTFDQTNMQLAWSEKRLVPVDPVIIGQDEGVFRVR